MVNSTIQKYLSVYAEPEIRVLSLPDHSLDLETESSQAYFVLPIFDETLECLLPFLETEHSKIISMIWVFNCPDNAEECSRIRTRKTMHELLGRFSFKSFSEQLYFSQLSSSLGLYVLDYCSSEKELPAKQGVGLARKLGMDLALMLAVDFASLNGGVLPWIHSCDADVTLPPDYFDIPEPTSEIAACLYPFCHLPETGYELAMALYELSLHYYVDRLRWAGSHYGYYSIGSLIVVNPLSYTQVRGMPKRAGAEDFYLLNKLAKVGKIISLEKPTLTIAGRPSHRVPFGTGPALSKLQEMTAPKDEYLYYHPDSFVALKAVIKVVEQTEQSFASLQQFYLQLGEGLPHELAEHTQTALGFLNIDKAFQHLGTISDFDQFKRAFHTWFDGFLTLRFIHLMRDQGLHGIPLQGIKDSVFSEPDKWSNLQNHLGLLSAFENRSKR